MSLYGKFFIYGATASPPLFSSLKQLKTPYLLTRAIKCSVNRNYPAQRVILFVIRENHQLRNIYKPSELLIRESNIVHTIAFRNHSALIIRLFNFQKDKRQAVYKQSDVGTKFFAVAPTGKFPRTMKDIVTRRIKINQFDWRYAC